MRPSLDVSEAFGPEFLDDTVVVLRRRQVIGDDGYLDRTQGIQRFEHVPCVICAASPNDLLRLPESQRTRRNLSVITEFKLQASAPGYLPDEIVWDGDTYVVSTVEPYARYGSGFVQTIATSIDTQDRAPGAVGQTVFNNPGNSDLI